MQALRFADRAGSGAECSCSPYSRGARAPAPQPQQWPAQAQPGGGGRRRPGPARLQGPVVGSAAIFEAAEAVAAPESELLSRDLFEAKFSGRETSKVTNLQTLERLKGDLNSALEDLEADAGRDFSVADWDKLNAARREHLMEELARQKEEVLEKERRKQERAAKRAARKAAAAASAQPAAAASPPQPQEPPIASSSSPRATGTGARRAVRGARAAARTRTRAAAQWGRADRSRDEKQAYLASMVTGGSADTVTGYGTNSMADYIKAIPRHNLLSAAEEAELSARVKDWLTVEAAYKRLSGELGRPPSTAEWAAEFGQEEAAFVARIKEGTRARSRMLTCNQRLVISIAKRYAGRGMDMADMVQEGMSGLLRSIDKFDPSKGFKFSTYATWWVRQSICRAVTDLSKVIRLPVHLHELLMRINKEEREFHLAHGRWPTDAQIAQALGMPAEKVKMVKQAALDPRSTDDPVSANDPESASLGELLQDDSEPEVGVTLIESSMQQDIDAVLRTLTRREYGILRMRYGLDDGKPKTLEEIGNAFHVTRERIRQIENKALAKLKDPLRHTSLKPYSDGEAMSLASEMGWRQSVNRNSSH